MKPTVVSADVLFEDHRDTLKWQWVAGLGASERRFDDVAIRAGLEREFKRGAKFVYLTPDFGNPSGVTVPLEQRLKLIDRKMFRPPAWFDQIVATFRIIVEEQ